MRQRYWIELLKDYDYDILYHPRKSEPGSRCIESEIEYRIFDGQRMDPIGESARLEVA